MPYIKSHGQKAAVKYRKWLANAHVLPVLTLTTIFTTLVLMYAYCGTVSGSNFMVTRATLDPASRAIALCGFALTGLLLVACEVRVGTVFSRWLVVALAVCLEAIVVINYGIVHVAWTFGFFVAATVYIIAIIRVPRLTYAYFLIVASFALAWGLRVGDDIVSILQLSTILTIGLLMTLHMFAAFSRRQAEAMRASSAGLHEQSDRAILQHSSLKSVSPMDEP